MAPGQLRPADPHARIELEHIVCEELGARPHIGHVGITTGRSILNPPNVMSTESGASYVVVVPVCLFGGL